MLTRLFIPLFLLITVLPAAAAPDLPILAKKASREFFTYTEQYGEGHLNRLQPYLTRNYLKELRGYGERRRDNERNRGYQKTKDSVTVIESKQHEGLPLVVCRLVNQQLKVRHALVTFRVEDGTLKIDRISEQASARPVMADLAEGYVRAALYNGVDGYLYFGKNKAEKQLAEIGYHIASKALLEGWVWTQQQYGGKSYWRCTSPQGLHWVTLIFKETNLVEVSELG